MLLTTAKSSPDFYANIYLTIVLLSTPNASSASEDVSPVKSYVILNVTVGVSGASAPVKEFKWQFEWHTNVET